MSDAVARAAGTAAHFMQQAGIDVRELNSAATIDQAADLLADLWQTGRETPPVNADVMRALAHTGNYVVGVYARGDLVGASVAFRSGIDPTQLHSHISGIASTMQHRGAGFALKLHQRAWALARGVDTITWTVDPLVRRNILFNLARLHADVIEYLRNFYGSMRDGVNANDESDRLRIAWRLLSAKVMAATESRGETAPPSGSGDYLLRVGPLGEPLVNPAAGQVRRCQLPDDIVALRSTDPGLAADWRQALRETLGKSLDDGWRVGEFARPGDYVLVR